MDLLICDADTNENVVYLRDFKPDCYENKICGLLEQAQQNSELRHGRWICIIGENLSQYDFIPVKSDSEVIQVRTFGRFEVFAGSHAIDFHSAKAKELFALCIDHAGGSVSIAEAVDKLWGNRPFDEKVKKLYRKAVMTINKTFEMHGIRNVFLTSRGSCRVNTETIKCDYFLFLKRLDDGWATFSGEYMTEYDWAEETLARLTRMAYGDFGNLSEKY